MRLGVRAGRRRRGPGPWRRARPRTSGWWRGRGRAAAVFAPDDVQHLATKAGDRLVGVESHAVLTITGEQALASAMLARSDRAARFQATLCRPPESAGAASLVGGGRTPVIFRRSMVRSSLISWLCFAAIWSNSSNRASDSASAVCRRTIYASRCDDTPAFSHLPECRSRRPGRSDRCNCTTPTASLAGTACDVARERDRPPRG